MVAERRKNAEAFVRAYLEQLNAIVGDSVDYSEWLHFAFVCNIETFSPVWYDFRKMYLSSVGKTNNLAMQFPLLILSAYLSTGKIVGNDNAAVSEKIRPLFQPEEPTQNTKQKYGVNINHVLQAMNELVQEIPNLSRDISKLLWNESRLKGEKLHQFGNFHSLMPLREFSIDLKDDASNSCWGTTATFTFGVLLE